MFCLICSHCCTPHTVTAVMVIILQRAVSLRPALRCLSPGFICSRAATLRLSARQNLPGASRHPGYSLRKLHSKKSPPGIPDRLPFSAVTEQDVAFFRQTLPGRAITDPDLLESCNVDWLKSAKGELESLRPNLRVRFSGVMLCISCLPGSSEVLLRPQTTEEVSKILK